MIRLRLFLERVGLKRILTVTLVAAALVAAGVVGAVVLQGGEKKTSTTATREPDLGNLFYLQAIAPKVQVRGCLMYIKFTWKPNYHADQYIGAPALIMASGPGIEGPYRKTFRASGVSLDVGPITLGGGYRVWSAQVASLDGDPPRNDTTIQAGAPTDVDCG